MGRRMRVIKNRFVDGERQSVGDHYVDAACTALNVACAKEAAMFVEGLTVHDVVPMLFRDEDVAKLKAVHGLLWEERPIGYYDLAPYCQGVIGIETKDTMPAFAKSALYWHTDRADRLARAVRGLSELHIKWGAVKHLLRWFNRNATPGAVRANWPSVMQLCPDAPALKALPHSPTRYTNPQELSALLPLIRDTSSTVATMAMIPGGAQPRTCGTVWITLPERTVDYANTTIKLDSQTFNL